MDRFKKRTVALFVALLTMVGIAGFTAAPAHAVSYLYFHVATSGSHCGTYDWGINHDNEGVIYHNGNAFTVGGTLTTYARHTATCQSGYTAIIYVLGSGAKYTMPTAGSLYQVTRPYYGYTEPFQFLERHNGVDTVVGNFTTRYIAL